ncbi:hypothetical protein QJS83_16950 [Bdellovibrio sp. 22V]|uniref:hypothetical protein n=1 Tax=Bdellovibrio sp. 22V TaxID=3044166 RepID=UPI002542D468|nr:hypothetical protein [Bdellovibrio sp. 22V]WII72153.1 hypothetical protein QJS83_16950 [Bdellovibrio sp. 22V]
MGSESSIGSVSIGWVLGIISGIAIEYFKRSGEEDRYREATQVELNESCITFAATFIQIQMGSYKISREDLVFCRELLSEFEIPVNREKYIKNLDEILCFNADQFAAHRKMLKIKNKGNVHNLQTLKLPYLSATPSLISLLGGEEQKSLVKILNYLERANSQINEIKLWARELISGKHSTSIESAYENGLEAFVITLKLILNESKALRQYWKNLE